MTKTELLTDLEAKDFVGKIVSTELSRSLPGNINWYIANLIEIKDNVAVDRSVHFYVVDEGEPTESAFYKDAPPIQNTRQSELHLWIRNIIDNSPDDYKGAQIHWISERWGMIIYSILEGSPLEQHTYYVRRGSAPIEISNFDITLMQSMFNV